MESDVPARLLDRLAALTNMPPDAIQRLILGPKEQCGGIKALRWFTKQKGATGFNKKMETVSDAAVTAAILPCLQALLQHLRRPENLCQEGLFRKSGSTSRQRDLKQRLLDGGGLDASAYTAHDCATVFKAMVADMPEPLLTRRLYNAYVFVHGMHGKERKVEATRILMSLLPTSNYSVAQDLLHLLHDVAQHVSTTKMTSSGLATIFAPHMMCSRLMPPSELLTASRDTQPCVTFMIEHVHAIFKWQESFSCHQSPLQLAKKVLSAAGLERLELLKCILLLSEAEEMVDCSSRNGPPHRKSAVELNVSSRPHLGGGGTRRRHSDHSGPSECISDPSLAGVSPMKRKHEDVVAPMSSYEIVPIVRLVRLHGAMLEASPFARRDAALPTHPAPTPGGAVTATPLLAARKRVVTASLPDV